MASDEFFYVVDGMRQDEDLHAPMLAAGIHVPRAQAGVRAAVKIGIDHVVACHLYGFEETGQAPLISS